jgi:ribonuclease-3
MQKLFDIIGYEFKNNALLSEAMTHPSFTKLSENNKNYQRLEFLGDKVLSLIIAEFLMDKYSKENEGNLSRRQAFLVSGDVLSEVALEISLNEFIILSAGEEKLGGRKNKRNLENALEALIGAIYLDSDFLMAKKIVLKLWQELLEHDSSAPKDPVSKLQEFTQLKTKNLPQYEISKCGGTDHDPEFEAIVIIEDLNIKFKAQGKSKKEAQKNVAKLALESLC